MTIVYREDIGVSVKEAKTSKLWHFMGIHKFLNLLISGKVYFAQLNQLRLNDPYEGWFGMEPYQGVPGLEGYDWSALAARKLFVSCWHVSPNEPAGLWKVYSDEYEGVAIQTTLGRIENAFRLTPRDIVAGEIAYDAIQQSTEPNQNTLTPAFRKRPNFEYEKEFRLCYFYNDGPYGGTAINIETDIPVGFAIESDLSVLIEKLYVGPHCEEWVFSTIKELCHKYELQCEVLRSEITEKPTIGRPSSISNV